VQIRKLLSLEGFPHTKKAVRPEALAKSLQALQKGECEDPKSAMETTKAEGGDGQEGDESMPNLVGAHGEPHQEK
jgi:hypothetical protein